MKTADEIFDHHIAVFGDGDLQAILSDYDAESVMIYRDKISAVCLNYREKGGQPSIEFANSQGAKSDAPYYGSDNSGLSLPSGLLTEEAQDEIEKNDFSIFFSRPELGPNDSKK